MSFNIKVLKEAMKTAGYVVSEGLEMTTKDIKEFTHYASLEFGLTHSQATYALAYPGTVTSAIPGHPDNKETTASAPAPTAAEPTVEATPEATAPTTTETTVETVAKTTPAVTETPPIEQPAVEVTAAPVEATPEEAPVVATSTETQATDSSETPAT